MLYEELKSSRIFISMMITRTWLFTIIYELPLQGCSYHTNATIILIRDSLVEVSTTDVTHKHRYVAINVVIYLNFLRYSRRIVFNGSLIWILFLKNNFLIFICLSLYHYGSAIVHIILGIYYYSCTSWKSSFR